MTHFEYIAVAISIVLSFAVLRLLDALPHVAAREKRYSIQALWVAMLLFWWLSVCFSLDWRRRTSERTERSPVCSQPMSQSEADDLEGSELSRRSGFYVSLC